MPLSCECNSYDYDDDVAWYWSWPADYSTLDAKRSRRCKSCGKLIRPGEIVARYVRSRPTRTEVEDTIYGEGNTVPLAPWFHCEECADLAFSLQELGYCFDIDDNMRDLVREHVAMRMGEE